MFPSHHRKRRTLLPSTTIAAIDIDMTNFVKASYDWPYNGNMTPENTCLLVIDMQADFCAKGGYVNSLLRKDTASIMSKPVEHIRSVLQIMRSKGYPIIHTREGHSQDLSDCPPNKIWRSQKMGMEIGSMGPMGRMLVRGEAGWEIIPELQPLEHETILDKTSKCCFLGTPLDLILRTQHIQNLIVTGITIETSIQTTMRNANDLGYECLLLEDCCASIDSKNQDAVITMMQSLDASMGAVCRSSSLIRTVLQSHPPTEPSPSPSPSPPHPQIQPIPKKKRRTTFLTSQHKLSRIPTFKTFNKCQELVPCKTKYIQLTCTCPKKVRVRTFCVCSPGIIRCNDCFANHILSVNTVEIELAMETA